MKNVIIKFQSITKNIVIKLQNIWDSIPGILKAIIYVTIAGLIANLQQDVLGLNITNEYIKILIIGVNDALLYLIQSITKKVKEDEEKE